MSYLRVLVESVEDGVIVTNRLRKVLDANQTLLQKVLILCECVENTLLIIRMCISLIMLNVNLVRSYRLA